MLVHNTLWEAEENRPAGSLPRGGLALRGRSATGGPGAHTWKGEG